MSETFNLENLSLFILAISIILILIFIWKRLKKHTLKIIGVMLIVSISILSNTSMNYFLAILIIATLVTKLDFLQNIAGIIRNSDSYFKYMQGLHEKSNEEIDEGIKNENKEIEEAINNEMKTDPNSVFATTDYKSSDQINTKLSPIQFGRLVEEYTFKYLEKKYNGNTKRHIREYDAFDGILISQNTKAFVEIKASRRGFVPISVVEKSLIKSVWQAVEYKNKNKHYHDFEVKFVIIGNHDAQYMNKISKILKGLVGNINISVDLYTLEDIGLIDII